MYYDPQRKLAFVFPIRTGSTTLYKILGDSGLIPIPDAKHIFIDDAIIKIPELKDYAVYGFFRDPVDRFLSIKRYLFQIVKNTVQRMNPVGLEFLEKEDYENATAKLHLYFTPQTKWLNNATLLDFRNYTPEVLRVMKMLDVKQVSIAVNNWTENSDEVPSQRVIDFVQSYYADDYRLGRERGLLA